jgi:hypothetical protein
MKYGESKGRDFESVWNAEERLNIIRQMDPRRHCVNCARGPANKRIIEMLRNSTPLAAEKDYDLF